MKDKVKKIKVTSRMTSTWFKKMLDLRAKKKNLKLEIEDLSYNPDQYKDRLGELESKLNEINKKLNGFDDF